MPESDPTRSGASDTLTADDRAADRPKRTFTLRAFSARDAVLLRFLLNIARDKTDHAWKYVTDLPADLLIVGPDADHAGERSGRDEARVTVRVQREGDALPGELTLPFKADELVHAVNVAGAAAQTSVSAQTAAAAVAATLMRARADASRVAVSGTAAHTPASPTSAAIAGASGITATASVAALSTAAAFAAAAPATVQIGRSQRVALKRWPDAALLARSTWHMKVAAILTGRPISVRDLAAKSGAPEDVCAAFVHALLVRDLAVVVAATSSAGPTAPAVAGPARGEGEAAGSASLRAAPPASGLIARIRARLRI